MTEKQCMGICRDVMQSEFVGFELDTGTNTELLYVSSCDPSYDYVAVLDMLFRSTLIGWWQIAIDSIMAGSYST